MSKAKTLLSGGLIAALCVLAIAALALGAYSALLFAKLPDARELADYRPPTATRVFAWDGTLIGEFSKERRVFVSYDDLPPRLVQAFLAAEDRNFFQHSGMDFNGMSRAMFKNVFNVLSGRRLEGGSTITQQVAKNVVLNSDATIGRKIKEAILAGRLESALSKQKILELYLNEIWLGYRSYGVAAAAQAYFGKSLSELTLAECAFLAALPKGPDNYHPVRRTQQAIDRRNWIIGEMATLNWISDQDAAAALAEPLNAQEKPLRTQYRDADFFVEEVRRRAIGQLGGSANQDGFYLRTTLEPKLQTAARIALMKGLENYDHRHGWRGGWGRVDLVAGWQAQARKFTPPSERRGWETAVIERAEGAQMMIRTAVSDDSGTLALEDVYWAQAGAGLNAGDLIFVEKTPAGAWRLRQVPVVNGALVALDPWTGRVLAMVGGYSFSLSSFNRATQAQRQPGSAFKPFVYAAALENGFTPASRVLDAAISLKGAEGEDWNPENHGSRFFGMQYLRRGLELSLNTMTIRLAQDVGMRKVANMAEAVGLDDDLPPNLSASLGAIETTPLQIAGAYAPFVNGGYRVKPHLISVIQDREGKTIYRSEARECPVCLAAFQDVESPRLPPPGPQAMDPVTAFQVTSMLQGVVQRGTATQASSLGWPLAGKTGTTNEYRSAWFVGYSTDMVVAVFVGFDDNRSLGENETGTASAVPIFVDFMKEAIKGRKKQDFKAPWNVKMISVNGRNEPFRLGTEPEGRVVGTQARRRSAYRPAGRGSSGAARPSPQAPIPYNELPKPAAPAPGGGLEGLY